MNTILVPTDGSVHALKAVDLACDLAEKHGAELLLFHVLLRDKEPEQLHRLAGIEGIGEPMLRELERIEASPPPATASAEAYMQDPNRVERQVPDEVLTAIGRQIVAFSRRRAEERGVNVRALELGDGKPADQILSCAARERADTIVIGSRGLGEIDAMTFGSVSHDVSHRAGCTCITVK